MRIFIFQILSEKKKSPTALKLFLEPLPIVLFGGTDGYTDTAKIEVLMKHSASLDLQIEQQLGQTTSYALIHPSPQIAGSGSLN